MPGSSVAKRDDGPTLLSVFRGEESPRRQVLIRIEPDIVAGLAMRGRGIEVVAESGQVIALAFSPSES